MKSSKLFDISQYDLSESVMLDKNGLPLQFPPSAFSAFSGLHAGLDPRASAWPTHPAFSAAAAAAAAQNSAG